MRFFLACVCGLTVLCLLAFLTTYEGLRAPRNTTDFTFHKPGELHLVMFAEGQPFTDSMRRNEARLARWVDRTHTFSMKDLDPVFQSYFPPGFFQGRGCGFYVWKPYVCLQVWKSLKEGDILWYADSHLQWTASDPKLFATLQECVHRCITSKSGGLFYGMPYSTRQFTKQKVYEALGVSYVKHAPMAQVSSTTFFLQKRASNESIVSQWLHALVAERGAVANDDLTDHDRAFYVRPRHDQSVISLLAHEYKMDVQWTYWRPQLDFPFRKLSQKIPPGTGFWR